MDLCLGPANGPIKSGQSENAPKTGVRLNRHFRLLHALFRKRGEVVLKPEMETLVSLHQAQKT